jgi:type II secretory pathway component PulF
MILNSYLVTVRDEAQQISKRLVSATSQAKVYAQMQREKCKVIAIEQRPSPFLEALKKGRLEIGDPASKRELATFSNNLALMVATKVNTANAFQILAESTPKERFRKIITDVRRRITDGESISQALANHPEAFDDVYVPSCRLQRLPASYRLRSSGPKP